MTFANRSCITYHEGCTSNICLVTCTKTTHIRKLLIKNETTNVHSIFILKVDPSAIHRLIQWLIWKGLNVLKIFPLYFNAMSYYFIIVEIISFDKACDKDIHLKDRSNVQCTCCNLLKVIRALAHFW